MSDSCYVVVQIFFFLNFFSSFVSVSLFIGSIEELSSGGSES